MSVEQRFVPLPPDVRCAMQNALGADFSTVTTCSSSIPLPLDALAFTCGEQIALAPDAPGFTTHAGRILLAHELVHVLQQRARRTTGNGFLDDAALEREADELAQAVSEGRRLALPWYSGEGPAEPRVIQCKLKWPFAGGSLGAKLAEAETLYNDKVRGRYAESYQSTAYYPDPNNHAWVGKDKMAALWQEWIDILNEIPPGKVASLIGVKHEVDAAFDLWHGEGEEASYPKDEIIEEKIANDSERLRIIERCWRFVSRLTDDPIAAFLTIGDDQRKLFIDAVVAGCGLKRPEFVDYLDRVVELGSWHLKALDAAEMKPSEIARRQKQTIQDPRVFRVAIVGAGPAGWAAAIEARVQGAQVDVFEKRDEFSRENIITARMQAGAKLRQYGVYSSIFLADKRQYSFIIKPEEVLDPVAIANRINRRDDRLMRYLFDQLSTELQALLNVKGNVSEKGKDYLRQFFSQEFNGMILEGEPIYSSRRCEGHNIQKDSIDALSESGTPLSNRMVLRDVFPNELAPLERRPGPVQRGFSGDDFTAIKFLEGSLEQRALALGVRVFPNHEFEDLRSRNASTVYLSVKSLTPNKTLLESPYLSKHRHPVVKKQGAKATDPVWTHLTLRYHLVVGCEGKASKVRSKMPGVQLFSHSGGKAMLYAAAMFITVQTPNISYRTASGQTPLSNLQFFWARAQNASYLLTEIPVKIGAEQHFNAVQDAQNMQDWEFARKYGDSLADFVREVAFSRRLIPAFETPLIKEELRKVDDPPRPDVVGVFEVELYQANKFHDLQLCAVIIGDAAAATNPMEGQGASSAVYSAGALGRLVEALIVCKPTDSACRKKAFDDYNERIKRITGEFMIQRPLRAKARYFLKENALSKQTANPVANAYYVPNEGKPDTVNWPLESSFSIEITGMEWTDAASTLGKGKVHFTAQIGGSHFDGPRVELDPAEMEYPDPVNWVRSYDARPADSTVDIRVRGEHESEQPYVDERSKKTFSGLRTMFGDAREMLTAPFRPREFEIETKYYRVKLRVRRTVAAMAVAT